MVGWGTNVRAAPARRRGNGRVCWQRMMWRQSLDASSIMKRCTYRRGLWRSHLRRTTGTTTCSSCSWRDNPIDSRSRWLQQRKSFIPAPFFFPLPLLPLIQLLQYRFHLEPLPIQHGFPFLNFSRFGYPLQAALAPILLLRTLLRLIVCRKSNQHNPQCTPILLINLGFIGQQRTVLTEPLLQKMVWCQR